MTRFISIIFSLLITNSAYSQCTNTTQWPTTTISASQYSDTVQISNDNYPGDYAVLDNLIPGESYIFISSVVGDYITIRDAYDSSILLGHGPTPYIFTPTTRDILAMHINLISPPCGTNSTIRNTYLHCTTCPDLPAKVDVQNAYLAVEGEVQLGDLGLPPQAGMIKWNPDSQDFEGYTGDTWVSLTASNQKGQWGSPLVNEMATDNKLVASDGASQYFFGSSVSIDGDYAVISNYLDDIDGNNYQGSVYVFHKEGTIWTEQAKIVASDGSAGDRFGVSVSISGDYIIVGSFFDEIAGNSDQGSAYIFHRQGTTWTEQVKLIASDGATEDYFGYSVSMDGDYAVVGSYYDDIGANADQGSAYIFHREGTMWTEQSKIVASDGSAGDRFGVSVSIDYNYVVVGSYRNDGEGVNNAGAAYIYQRTGSTWTEQTKLIASFGTSSEFFGYSVSIDNNYVAIGTFNFEGSVYIFRRIGSTWSEEAKIVDNDGVSSDFFGHAVSIDGDYVVIGSYGHNNNQGAIYIFQKTGSTWTKFSKVIANDHSLYDRFGTSVAISKNYIVAGSSYDDIGDNLNQGSAYIISRK